MALAQSRWGDLDETGLDAEILDGGDAAVAHARLQSADELVDDVGDQALVGNAGLDALGDELLQILHALLEVPVAASARHGAQGTHALVDLVRAALVEDR